MTDHDIRRALASYADTTPSLDPRAGLDERFARRARARRAAIAGTAVLAAVIAGTSVATLTRDRGTAAVVASGDQPSETPGAESPSPDASPTPEPEPTSEPTADPTETAASPTASPEPGRPDTTPIVRTAGGDDGLRVKVTLAPGSVPAATLAKLTVEAQDDDGQPFATALSWGDGTSEPIAVMAVACASRQPPLIGSPSPSPRAKAPGTLDRSFSHAWRQAGRYTVVVKIRSEVWCAEDEPPREEQTIRFDVDVTPGEKTSNGPAEPRVYGHWGATQEDRTVLLTASVSDADGWVSALTIDWGDGSPLETLRSDESCADGDGRHYPERGYVGDDLEHTYAKDGTYTVKITGTTTGCDGGDPQSGTLSLDVPA